MNEMSWTCNTKGDTIIGQKYQLENLKRQLGRPKRRRENNIKIYLKETGFDILN
jgi:hypothetical protein